MEKERALNMFAHFKNVSHKPQSLRFNSSFIMTEKVD